MFILLLTNIDGQIYIFRQHIGKTKTDSTFRAKALRRELVWN